MGRLQLVRRAVALSLAVPVVALVVAGCGQRLVDDRSSPAHGIGARTWLLRVDAYSGEDGVTEQATYVSIVPATGSAQVVTTPALRIAEASGSQRMLLVDAGHRWALTDSRPAGPDRARGLVRLTALGPAGPRGQEQGQEQGQGKVVDVRRITGDQQLRADWASFDPERPGVLRVVDGLRVWSVDLAASSARRQGVLPRRPGWIFGGGFNPNTGRPYIEDTGSFDTLPAGNGETDQRPIRRAGGRLLLGDNGRLPGLPSPGCGLPEGFRESSGRSWVFCVVGRHVQVKTLAAGSARWRAYGEPTGDVLPAETDPAFVLPGQPPRR